MSYGTTIVIDMGPARTGLTLVGKLLDAVGDQLGADITAGFSEVGGGVYMMAATIPSGWDGAMLIEDDSDPTIRAVAEINPETLELPSLIASLTSRLNAATITLTSPMAGGGSANFTIIHGDAYEVGSYWGPIEWTETTGAWQPFVGQDAIFSLKDSRGQVQFSKAVDFIDVDGTEVLARLELTSAETESFDLPRSSEKYDFDVQVAAVPGSQDVTPIRGQLKILVDVSEPSTV